MKIFAKWHTELKQIENIIYNVIWNKDGILIDKDVHNTKT